MTAVARPSLRVAVAQITAVGGDIAGNVARHLEMLDEAVTQGANLLVFPELSIPGYAGGLLNEAPERCLIDPEGEALAPLREACRAKGIAAIVSGGLPDPRGMTLSSLVIDRNGQIATRYDKRHLDSDERAWFVPGIAGDRLLHLDGWRLGLGICYDSSFPEQARGLARQGADAYLVSGAFPQGASDHRRTVYFPARALENTVYVVFANYAGSHGGYDFCGRSALYDPEGHLLAEASATKPDLIVCDFQREALIEVRHRLQMLRDLGGTETPTETVAVA